MIPRIEEVFAIIPKGSSHLLLLHICYFLHSFFSPFFILILFSEINNPAKVRKVPTIAIEVIFSLSIKAENATVITGTA